MVSIIYCFLNGEVISLVKSKHYFQSKQAKTSMIKDSSEIFECKSIKKVNKANQLLII